MHFGQLSPKKGTDWLARVLPRVWEREPEFSMVWAGPDHTGSLPAWRTGWGEHSERVVWLGELPRPSLYAVLERAEAAVLPSRADNLPNTAIESLALGLPVIGTAGASLDELVEDGRSGELVPLDDDDALACALLRAWRGQSVVRRVVVCDSDTVAAMQPPRAVEALLALARSATRARAPAPRSLVTR